MKKGEIYKSKAKDKFGNDTYLFMLKPVKTAGYFGAYVSREANPQKLGPFYNDVKIETIQNNYNKLEDTWKELKHESP